MMGQQDLSVKKIEGIVRMILPYALLAVLLLVNVISLPMFPSNAVRPQFVLMALYYWAIYRPTLMPPSLCFIVGLLMDILSGLPLGINALVLVLIQWTVRDQRRFLMGQPYGTIWAVFGLVCGVSILIQWALYGMTQMHWIPILPLLGGEIISLLLFPFVTLLLIAVHRILPVASRPYS